MRYMLDTDICNYVIGARPRAVPARFLAHEAEGLGVSAVTACELWFGVRKSGSRRNLALFDKFPGAAGDRRFRRRCRALIWATFVLAHSGIRPLPGGLIR